jgi:RNA polymerase sigma-70 factor (ECF subfamily)
MALPSVSMDPAQTEEVFLKLYDEQADSLFRHCYFRVSSRELAEDLTQESFMRVWKYLAEGNAVENPKALLYRVAGNLIIDYYRRKKETSLEVLAEGGYDPVGDTAVGILEEVEGKRVIELLAELEPQHREILTFRYVDHLELGEIADLTGQTENTVSVRIHRATEKLKTLFHHGTN